MTIRRLLAERDALNCEIEADTEELQQAQDALERKVERLNVVNDEMYEKFELIRRRQNEIGDAISRRFQHVSELEAKGDANSLASARGLREDMTALQAEYDELQSERVMLVERTATV